MSNLTVEQQLAVEKKDTNIIVSAGAGSGKTTVLKKRVERILLSGVNINDLIILTFTNNAASEMKERIRKIITDNPDLIEQAELLDSAYITTFDSFAQSLVKKYNYLLNIDKNFSIVDDSIINLEIEKIIDEIFEELYGNNNADFIKVINDLEVKDDKRIRDAVKLFYKGLTNIINRECFLENYIDNFYSDDYIEKSFNLFENIIFKLRDSLLLYLEDLKEETLKDDILNNLNFICESLESASSFDDLYALKSISLPAARKGYFTEEGKEIKKKADAIKKEISEYLLEDKNTLIQHYKDTLPYAKALINILKKLDEQLNKLKKEHNIFQFFDIAFLAIELVKNHEDVRNEIKYKTYEIMIDEYQDTNDIQEEFISYIQNNNVYTVGDIKQSIYRFRNANPYIFKKRYDNYSNNVNGFKIDLNKNFRSRKEVIDDINLIFNEIMFDYIGGADYKKTHQMIYGNTEYLKHTNSESYKTEIIEYDNDGAKYKENEIEAFIIAEDILNRLASNESVTYFDKDEMKSRTIDYKDFCILVDKSKNFDLLKKVLEYKGIPCTIYKDIVINDEDEIYILKNLINLIISVHEEKLDMNFKHSFLAIARSYVAHMSDDEIYKIIVSGNFKDTVIYSTAYDISLKIDSLSNREIFNLIVEKFDVINKLNLVGDIDERLTKLEYFMNNITSLNNMGMDIYALKSYFDELLQSNELITMTTNKNSSSNTVKIMTIHASKGLEYPYVYLPYLNSDIKRDPNISRFKFSSNFGFILPFYQNGVGSTFINTLYKYDENIQNLSEKIRLFYVALTRAKEKIIIINKFNKNIEPVSKTSEEVLISTKSVSDILTLIKYKLNSHINKIDLDKLNICSDYNYIGVSNYREKIGFVKEKIKVKKININSNLIDNKHFSKSLHKVIDRDLKERLEFGTFMHYVFEVFDFKNNNLADLNIDEKYKEKVYNFLKHEEVKNIKHARCFKEHEVRFIKDGAIFHGFIDLLVEYEDHYDIIDYKLSNIDDKEYSIQLNGYKDYIETMYKKPCDIYLYSINKDIFKQLN